VFGYLVYIHLLEKKMTKLEPSSIKGIFFIQSIFKAYRIYIPSQKKTLVSIYVNVDEDVKSLSA
jgi:hypothetical protein